MLVQGGREWPLEKHDADAAFDVSWTVLLPPEVSAGGAVLRTRSVDTPGVTAELTIVVG